MNNIPDAVEALRVAYDDFVAKAKVVIERWPANAVIAADSGTREVLDQAGDGLQRIETGMRLCGSGVSLLRLSASCAQQLKDGE